MSTNNAGSRWWVPVLWILALAGLTVGLAGAFLAVAWVTVVGLVGAGLLALLVIPWVVAARRR